MKISRMLSVFCCAALTLALCACGADTAASTPSSVSAPASSSAASDGAPSTAAEQATLYIARADTVDTIAVSLDALTPEALLDALAAETGWNLTLAAPVAEGDNDTLRLAFAADSAIYSAPPASQSVEDYVLTVLSSVNMTLTDACQLYGVCFTAPDGGDLLLQNGDFSLHLRKNFAWEESLALAGGVPLPSDSIGACFFDPGVGSSNVGGLNLLTFRFYRAGVTLGGGSLTLRDASGRVVDVIDAQDTDRVIISTPSEFFLDDYNFSNSEGTELQLLLATELSGDADYTVECDEGFFTADGISSARIAPETYSFHVTGSGLFTTDSTLSADAMKHGEARTFRVVLDDTVEYAECTILEGEGTLSATRLTESGELVVTAGPQGDSLVFSVNFYEKDRADDSDCLGLTAYYSLED